MGRALIKNLISSCFIILCCVEFASSQTEPNRLAQHKSIEQKIRNLTIRQDSTLAAIDVRRKLYQSEYDKRSEHANHIINLEDQLYDIRANLEQLKLALSKLNIESVNNDYGSTSDPEAASRIDKQGLLANAIFTQNLNKESISKLSKVHQADQIIPSIIDQIDVLYGKLKNIKQEYDTTQHQDIVDSLLDQSVLIKQQIKTLDDSIRMLWVEPYQFKSETFIVINDHARIDRLTLENLAQESRNINRNESIAESGLATCASVYYQQRDIILKNELAIALKLGIARIADSIRKEQNQISQKLIEEKKMVEHAYEDIEFQPRLLIVYSAVNTSGSEALTSMEQIPELKLPSNGVYYTIQVALMQTPAKSISMFRKASPLQVQKLSDGRVRYTLGGYDDYAKAQKDVNNLLRAGFRAPTIVAWVDGKYTAPLKAKAEQEKRAKEYKSAETASNSSPNTPSQKPDNTTSAQNPKNPSKPNNSAQVSTSLYMIEVVGSVNSTISQDLRELLSKYAADKKTARIMQANNYVFSITQFESLAKAEHMADILRSNGIENVRVLEIK